jgi:acyl carrier protein
MQLEQIEATLAEILQTITGKHTELKRATLLQDDLGLDSLTRIDFAVRAEDAFGVAIPDENLESFATVGDVLAFLDRSAQGQVANSITARH